MMLFRHMALIRVFSLFTGVIFLNMSFFLAELSMLELKDKEMIENVCNLVLNAGLEEERDAHSSGADVPLKVLTLSCTDLLIHHTSLYLIAVRSHEEWQDHYLHADHSEIVSPPPEVSIS